MSIPLFRAYLLVLVKFKLISILTIIVVEGRLAPIYNNCLVVCIDVALFHVFFVLLVTGGEQKRDGAIGLGEFPGRLRRSQMSKFAADRFRFVTVLHIYNKILMLI
jgi:hypothetical protein